MSDPRPPRTDGGTLLRQAMDEARAQVDAEVAKEPGRDQVTAFIAYDKQTGAQLGAAYYWQGEKGSEWTVTAALSRKVQASPSPYAVRLELHGRL